MRSSHKSISGDQFTPPRLVKALSAPVLLESASLSSHQGRYSIIMVDEAFRLEQLDEGVLLRHPSERRGAKSFLNHTNILDCLPSFYEQHDDLGDNELPIPAAGIGYLGFPYCRYCDTIEYSRSDHRGGDPIGIPDAIILFGHSYIIFDHYHDRLHVVALSYSEAEIDTEERVSDLITRIQDKYVHGPIPKDDPAPFQHLEKKSSSEEGYTEGVRALHSEFRNGNLYQCVLSRRITIESSLDPFVAYRRLRSSNPSPYMFFLDFGSFQLIGASPEMHAKVSNGEATIRPIAGTCRRGKTEAEDKTLTEALRAHPKERAEHLMLVDLARNDLGRICEPGSVTVTECMVPEYFSSVIHLTSNVVGTLNPDTKPADVIHATFPAGTLSGAPKIRAIETLPKHELFSRSFYGGIIGHFEARGNFDSCIAIRSALCKDGTWTVQVGGGIVMDSEPERELEETKEKSAAVLRALGLNP